MATRKQLDLGPHKGVAPADKIKKDGRFYNLDTVIRSIQQGDAGRAESVLVAATTALKRLGVKDNRRKAVKTTPDGSDHVDIASFARWCESVKPRQRRAIDQLLTVHATALARLGK